jgi:hypothetical protein
LANTDRHDVLKRLEAEETAKRLMEMRQRMDELDAKKEFRDAVIQSRKNWYRHKGKVYS